jgi:hypothetical protein
MPLNIHGEHIGIATANQNLIFGVFNASPLGPRLERDLTLLSDRARNSLKLQSESVEVNSAVGESNVVLTVVASGALFRRSSVAPVIP